VREMLVTGNFIDLWNHLAATADDARLCMSKLIPTLAFESIDCNA
jgi:PmbA protein